MSAATPTPAMRTPELLERLRRHYIKPQPLPGGVFLPEVTYGGAGGRRCDALHVGFTSTSGRILTGHELKVSRADWRHELDQPGKADTWADACHAWYVVAPSVDIVRPEELPAGWGLMVPGRSKTRMDVVVRARVHDDRVPTWEAVRAIVARMDSDRASRDAEARAERDQLVRAEVQRQVDKAVAGELERRARHEPDREALAARVRAVEVALGGRVVDGDDRPYIRFRRPGEDWRADAEQAVDAGYPRNIPDVPLRQVGDLLHRYRTIRQAARALASGDGFGGPRIRDIREAADELETALAALGSLAEG